MHFCPCRRMGLGAHIRPSEARHLMSRLNQLAHHGRTYESCTTGNENTRGQDSLFIPADRIEISEGFGWNLEQGSLKILSEMFEGRCSGNQEDVRRAPQKPCQRELHWCGPQRGRRGVERR